MARSDWGWDEPPRVFGREGWGEPPIYSDRTADLPDVAAASLDGYFPADESPLWCFLPAIWPTRHRAWIPDRRVRHLVRTFSDGRTEQLPWTAAEYADVESDINQLLRDIGVPPRPAGRVWLLRPPAIFPTLDAYVESVWSGWLESGGVETATAGLVDYTQQRLDRAF